MPHMIFTKHLLFILQEKIRKKGSLISPQDAFSKLTTPAEDSIMQKEYEDLLRILIKIENDSKLKNIFKDLEPRHVLKEIKEHSIKAEIENHQKEYGWLGYGYIGPDWNEIYFIGIISSLIRQNNDPNKLLDEVRIKKEGLIKEQEKIMKTLELDQNEKLIFEVARSFVFAKGYRKDAMCKSLSRIEPLFKEIARRLHISLTDIRFCYPHEFEELIKRNPKLLEKLQERQKFLVTESTGIYKEDLYLTGKKAKNYLSKLNFVAEETTEVSILNGSCACPGRVRGKVKIINFTNEMEKMDKGDILVSVSTTPDLVPAMKKAAAIVTDTGGITSHAAIVSRELNIPCVVGTKIATKVLKDNMLIDVDATHGIVKIIKN